jgi:MFS family permease
VSARPPAWAFPLLLAGELVSVLGSGLSGFAVAVWSFKTTGSVTTYSVIALCAMLPWVLLSPLAGVFVDRFSRKKILVAGNLACALLTGAAVLIARAGHIQPWHVGVLTILTSSITVFQMLAFQVSTALLVSADQLGRATGLAHAGTSGAQLIAPGVAGALVAVLDLPGILALDGASFLFAALASLFLTIPQTAAPHEHAERGSLRFGLRAMSERPGLTQTLVFQSIINLATGFAFVLLLPLVLAVGTEAAYGGVMTAAGVGMLAGALVVGAWGANAKRVRALWGGGAVLGAALIAGSLLPSVAAIAACAAAAGFSLPLVNATAQVLFQSAVPIEQQGRVLAARQAIISAMVPLAYLVAGPLADHVFKPATILFAMGAASLLAAAWALADRRLRALGEPPPSSATQMGEAR